MTYEDDYDYKQYQGLTTKSLRNKTIESNKEILRQTNEFFHPQPNEDCIEFLNIIHNTNISIKITYKGKFNHITIIDKHDGEETTLVVKSKFHTTEEKIQALKKSVHHIFWMQNLSQEAIEIAIEKTPRTLKCIQNPSFYMQNLAIQKDPFCIASVKNPCEEIQMKALKTDPFVISHIKNPTEKAQLYVVRRNNYWYKFLKNPTNRVNKTYKKTFI